MPHATEDVLPDESGLGSQINQLLYGGGIDSNWNDEQRNDEEKSDNAQDFEDISDDDLPEEEEATNNVASLEADQDGLYQHLVGDAKPAHVQTNGSHDHEAKQNGDGLGDVGEDNDLFGERMTSSPVEERRSEIVQQPLPPRPGGLALPTKSGLVLPRISTTTTQKELNAVSGTLTGEGSPEPLGNGTYSPAPDDDDLEGVDDPTLRAQMQLFRISKLRMQGEDVDWDPIKTQDENKFWQRFPTWEDDEVPRFCELLPPIPGKYRGKIPPKPPKAVQPTKVTLELMQDQERSFRAATIAGKASQDAYRGRIVISLEDPKDATNDSDDEFASDEFDATEQIGGVTMQDLTFICQDWDVSSIDSLPLKAEQTSSKRGSDDAWGPEEKTRSDKRRRVGVLNSLALPSVNNTLLRFDDPERAAAKFAKSAILDMNDPHLLLDEHAPQIKRKTHRVPGDNTRDAAANRDLARRYNISNDEAYDLLKENHQHKIRSTLGSMAIEHSLPATKLQWPFYKVTLDGKEKRAFHRQHLNLHEQHGRTYKISKPRFQKKKYVRGREAKDLFAKAEDLSFGDNSSALLLEYSEEVPTTLSNFGMGNRMINYYRKRDADDQERPKREIGEAHVLLHQDKSPFANFGHVDSGETVPTVQNGLFRAPVFQHQAKPSDFVLAVSHTHEGGNRLFLRNMENLHTVGQQLPIAEVPGEHSRRVTDAAKKRLRAISYRIYTKTLDPARRGISLTNKTLMRHIPGSDIPQTRSKMREFMKYEKKAKNSEDDGYWVPMPGQPVPDAETIRGWIRPEDVCLLDTMQVGVQHLNDLGISTGKNEEENEDEELEEGAHIEKQLAPWQTTKNFMAATQGKAMLALHGEGDPTGRGEAFSFIRTSMKGGYVAEGESVEEKLSERKRKEQGGHKYNVATQQAKYDANIRLIWNRQKSALGNDIEMSDTELDDIDAPAEQDAGPPYSNAPTPRTSFGTPAAGFDDSASQFSKQSVERGDEVLIIKRKQRDAYGNWVETPVRIDNAKVIKLYRRRKQEMRLAKLSHTQLRPTGDPELDALAQQELKKELARLERNKDRRMAREKLKGRIAAATGAPADAVAGNTIASSPNGAAGSPASEADAAAGDSNTTTPQKTGKGRSKDGTARKCANCGQVGHIKTNRKKGVVSASANSAKKTRKAFASATEQDGSNAAGAFATAGLSL